jgi:aminoglycoside phosphotransferase (APT) family kinase protein
VIDTIPVRADEHFPVESVVNFLRSSGVAGFDAEHMQVEQFPAGQSNLTYLLHAGDWEAVLRRPPLGPVAPRAHDMAREFHILERLHPAFPLAPKPYVLCEDTSIIGAPFYVMERRRGLVLDQELPVDWKGGPQLHTEITDSLVKTLVDLHAVDWHAIGLGEIGRPEGYMQRQVGGWIDRLRRARTNDLADVEPLFEWLSTRTPESPPPTVIHNDYKLNNVLLDYADPRHMTAVLDWEMATVGDPLSDVASLLVYWTPADEIDLMGGIKSVTAEAGFPGRDEISQLYARLSGRDLSDLQFYLAFAYFKIGVILQQIYYRWHQGQTHDDRFASHGAVATNLIARAAEVAGLRRTVGSDY